MRKACSIVFGLGGILCLLGLWYLKGDPRTVSAADTAAHARSLSIAASGLGDSTFPETAAVVHQDMGRLELVKRVAIPEVQLAHEIVEPPVRVKFGDAPTITFAVKDRVVAHPSASVFHGKDEVLQVPVLDVGDGVFEVAFTPTGPGQFQVVLNDAGTPVATKTIGVVGVAGAPGQSSDADFLSVDPREPRMRTAGRASRR
jgi:hypothetical protein